MQISDLTTIVTRSIRRLRSFIPALAGTMILANIAVAQGSALDEGWDLLARYLYRDAGQVFDLAQAADPRAVKFGRAASLLNEPPITAGKIERAEQLLREVTAGGAQDTTAVYARYLLARILHMHREAAVPEIEAAYRAVLAAGTDTAIAQVAASHLALILLYQRDDLSVGQRLAAAAELEPAAVGTALPDVAAGYYRLLAEASMFYEIVDLQVVDWLEKAHAIGATDQFTQIGLCLQLAETARKIGEKEKALKYYREFIATTVPTDQRFYTAKLRMQELEATL